MLTEIEVTRRVEEIRQIAPNDEDAHEAEDRLHRDVLTAIAYGVCDDPAGCSRAALVTRSIKFCRWCA